jgi:hypothetical protein
VTLETYADPGSYTAAPCVQFRLGAVSNVSQAVAVLQLHVGHQISQIGALGILDQMARHERIETVQMHDDLGDSFRLMQVMVRHAQRIPGVGIHRLQHRGFKQCLCSFGAAREFRLSPVSGGHRAHHQNHPGYHPQIYRRPAYRISQLLHLVLAVDRVDLR